MDADAAALLRRLLAERPVAALGTLHGGEPAVSMVPFVFVPQASQLLIHVSALATHTRDMRDHPRVAVLVMAQEDASVPAQALPRVSLVAQAVPLARGSAEAVAGRERYLARFPDAAQTFELGDFSLVALQVQSARVIAGFGRAYGLAGEALRELLRS